jgi:predicted metal-dependent HD superfamily phosphohydrolase
MQTLQHSWRRAWTSLGVDDTNNSLFDELIARYSETHRKYHTLQHLNECIAKLEAALELAEHPGEVEIGLWFHDAVYDVKRQDNELQSALWAKSSTLEAGATPQCADRICALVMATQHAARPSSRDEQLLVDIDLSILGAPQERFDEYELQIRQEYAWVPDGLFHRKRRAILEDFLARPFIYCTSYFRSAFEAAARENLRRSISRLGG